MFYLNGPLSLRINILPSLHYKRQEIFLRKKRFMMHLTHNNFQKLQSRKYGTYSVCHLTLPNYWFKVGVKLKINKVVYTIMKILVLYTGRLQLQAREKVACRVEFVRKIFARIKFWVTRQWTKTQSKPFLLFTW